MNSCHGISVPANCTGKGPSKILAVASGKGGVGKTNLCANLSICLSNLGKRVLLLDADMSLANLDMVLNTHSKYNISHVINGRKQMEEVVHHGPWGVDMVCGTSGLENLANLGEFQQKRLVRELSKLQHAADFVIIDNAAGIARSVVSFCLAADHVLVVTTPDATSMTDAYSLIKVLHKNSFVGHMSLIVNMADSLDQAKKIYLQVAKVARQFLGLRIFYAGAVLYDQHLVSAVRGRIPVVCAHPKSKASHGIRELASRLGHASSSRNENPTFLRKVVNWFY